MNTAQMAIAYVLRWDFQIQHLGYPTINMPSMSSVRSRLMVPEPRNK